MQICCILNYKSENKSISTSKNKFFYAVNQQFITSLSMAFRVGNFIELPILFFAIFISVKQTIIQ